MQETEDLFKFTKEIFDEKFILQWKTGKEHQDVFNNIKANSFLISFWRLNFSLLIISRSSRIEVLSMKMHRSTCARAFFNTVADLKLAGTDVFIWILPNFLKRFFCITPSGASFHFLLKFCNRWQIANVQWTFTCSKSTTETLEKGVKHV